MAGAGYKLFSTGDVLSASDVNTYLMQQTVMSFASAAARTTALASVLAEGLVSYLQDTNVVEIYTGAAWVSLDDPNAIQNTLLTTTGDMIAATSANTPARLAAGTSGQVLTANGAGVLPSWQAPAAGGGITLLSTTALSTATTTISIASGYKNVYLVMRDLAVAASGNLIQMRFNSDTGSNYFSSNYFGVGTTTGSQVETNTAIQLTPATQSSNTNADATFIVNIYDYLNTASKRIVTVQGNYIAAGGSNQVATNTVASYLAVGTAISSVTIFTSSTLVGSALLYGVN